LDAIGDSAVIEYADGKQVVHYGREGIMTNAIPVMMTTSNC